MRKLLWNFYADDDGGAAIEFGLLAAGIAVAIVAVAAALGTQPNSDFTGVSSRSK